MRINRAPAYGRDYKNEDSVYAHWIADRDFLIQDVSCKDNGRFMMLRNLNG